MTYVPFVITLAQPRLSRVASRHDELTGEDPLPAAVDMTREGCAVARTSRHTAVVQETTDDR